MGIVVSLCIHIFTKNIEVQDPRSNIGRRLSTNFVQMKGSPEELKEKSSTIFTCNHLYSEILLYSLLGGSNSYRTYCNNKLPYFINDTRPYLLSSLDT